MKILIAEDEPNIARIYKISFEDAGHDVIISRDGVECVETYKSELAEIKTQQENSIPYPKTTPFDVVILDYRMPKKDGMEVAREIIGAEPGQRIIFVSAYVLSTLEE